MRHLLGLTITAGALIALAIAVPLLGSSEAIRNSMPPRVQVPGRKEAR